MANAWVDYANLGLNVANVALNSAQLQSLSEVNSQLAQLSQLEANRERRSQYENSLRQFVFEEELKLSELVNIPQTTPAKKWFAATIIQQNLDSVPVSASSFQEYVDKDRVTDFRRRLRETIEESQGQLTGDEVSNLLQTIKILNERSALTEYIAAVKAKEHLKRTQVEWEKKESSASKVSRFLGCLAPIFLVILGLFFVFLTGHTVFGVYIPYSLSLISLIMFIVGILLVIIGPRLAASRMDGYDELNFQRNAAKTKIPPSERLQVLGQMFGANVTSEDLLREQQRREQILDSTVSMIG